MKKSQDSQKGTPHVRDSIAQDRPIQLQSLIRWSNASKKPEEKRGTCGDVVMIPLDSGGQIQYNWRRLSG